MVDDKKSKMQKDEEKLVFKRENAWTVLGKDKEKKVMDFCEEYKDFMGVAKTERTASENIRKTLEKNGFRSIDEVKSAKPGDRLYKQVKSKTLIAFVVGKNMEEFRIIGSHLDSPRMDLKPFPVGEESGLGMMKTHYYGGIKKYQWVNHPLEMHGVVHTSSGKKVEINVGSRPEDPKFIIPDLLPHLAKKQMERDSKTVVEGEELNVLAGSIPVDDENIKNKVKLSLLKELEDKYGVTEEDFCFAEIELVPSVQPVDIGFDRSLIGAYAHDDKVCAYTSLQALLESDKPNSTAIAFFADKEEIGSVGNTGAASLVLNNFAYDYADLTGVKSSPVSLLENAKAISADVTAGVNPNHKDVHDHTNASFIGGGVSVEKYGGSGGKYVSNDTHAEFMAFIRDIIKEHNVPWQTGELGKVDLGGGGTIAMFMSRYGMDCVDIGPCVLAMHSPCEIVSKADIYSAYMLYKGFFRT